MPVMNALSRALDSSASVVSGSLAVPEPTDARNLWLRLPEGPLRPA